MQSYEHQSFSNKNSKMKLGDQVMNPECHHEHSFSFNQGHDLQNQDEELVKGMFQVNKKNKIIDLWSKKKTWEDLGIPE